MDKIMNIYFVIWIYLMQPLYKEWRRDLENRVIPIRVSIKWFLLIDLYLWSRWLSAGPLSLDNLVSISAARKEASVIHWTATSATGSHCAIEVRGHPFILFAKHCWLLIFLDSNSKKKELRLQISHLIGK